MKYLNKFKEFESSNFTDLERLSSFYEGDKYEIKITKDDNKLLWYNNLLDSIFVAVKHKNDWKIVPPKLLTLFNISAKDYPDYNNKIFLNSSVLYVNFDDCEIVKTLD